MKVSIIIPAYNVEKYIRKCLNSAIKQTFEETQYEIIVINDCSKDQTLKILKKYKSKFKNFNIITNKKTKGPGLSRNTGIKHSSGKYIFFLDGEPQWLNGIIQFMIRLAKLKEPHRGFKKIQSNFHVLWSRSEQV